MSHIFWISNRLKLNGRSRGANTAGVIISVTGMALAVMIMEFTIAIVLGFKNQITERVESFEGKVWVLPAYDRETGTSAETITRSAALDSIIRSVAPEADTYMRFSQAGLLKTDNNFAGVYFTGDDNGVDEDFEKEYTLQGQWPKLDAPEDKNKIAISKTIAATLGLNVGDKVYAYFFVNEAVKSRRFEVSALYETGFGDYDQAVVFAPITTLRQVAGADSLSGTKLMVDVKPGTDLAATASVLQDRFINEFQLDRMAELYPVDNARNTGAAYFNWLDLLNTNVVAIFTLMICVSGITLVSSMFIIILERISTIGILRSLGATKGQVRSIFVYMALRIVGIGLLIGNAVGIPLLYAQQLLHIVKLDPEMYYLKYVPVEMRFDYFLLLNIGIVCISWIILILPSRVASRISPVVTMRFE